jgi:hypothetical protein
MTTASEASARSKLPTGLMIVIACCFLRAAVSLSTIAQMIRYIITGATMVYAYLFASLVQVVVWTFLGIGLLRLAARARIAAIIICGIILAWSSYLALSAMLHQTIQHWNVPLFVFNIITDFAIIAYLAQSRVKALFEPKEPALLK